MDVLYCRCSKDVQDIEVTDDGAYYCANCGLSIEIPDFDMDEAYEREAELSVTYKD